MKQRYGRGGLAHAGRFCDVFAHLAKVLRAARMRFGPCVCHSKSGASSLSVIINLSPTEGVTPVYVREQIANLPGGCAPTSIGARRRRSL